MHANMLNALLNSIAATVVVVDSGEASTASVFSTFQRSATIFFPYKPDWSAGATFVIILVLGLSMSMLFSILGAASMAVTASGLVIASIWINFQ